MSRTFYQSLKPNGFVEDEIIVENPLPTMSCVPSYSSNSSQTITTRFMDTVEITDPANSSQKTSVQIDISGILWMLATMAIRNQLDNAALPEKDVVKVVELDDNGNEIPVRKTKKGAIIREEPPVIGLLCRDVLHHIMHFALGISHETVGYTKNNSGELVSVSRQDHLMNYACFLFSKNHLSDFMLNDLIRAVKNDDRAFVADVIEKTPTYLCLENGDGLIALAMAFQTDNTVLIKMIIDALEKLPNGKMIIAEQLQKIFPEGYDAHCKIQEREARQLFVDAGILDSDNKWCIFFRDVSQTDLNNVVNHVPNTDSALHQRLARLDALLTDYARTHPFHNDYFLQLADEIYMKSFCPWSDDQCYLFSYHVINVIQREDAKTSLFRLKNHAQGIFYSVENNEAPRDSFLLRDTNIDIRSLLNRLSVNCCITVFGDCAEGAARARGFSKAPVEPKTRILSDIMQQYLVHREKQSTLCAVM